MFFLKRKKISLALANILILLGLLFAPLRAVLASTYGSGSYGMCAYSQGCSSSGGTTITTTTTPTSSTGSSILLNDFSGYFQSSGVTLDLKVNQVIYFDVTVNGVSERHSITIKKIGPDCVVLTLASTPYDVTLCVGDTKQYDVNGDGVNDIEISLNSISTNGKANLTFRALKPPSTPAPAAAAVEKHHNWLWLIVSIAFIVVALGLFFWLAMRRKNRDQPGPH